MQNTSPRILVIITTYGRPGECARLLAGLDRIVSYRFDVFLTENSSSADYSPVVEARYGFKLIYEKLDENFGLPITYNRGIVYALRHGYDYIWVLDDDTMVEEGTLAPMVEELERNPMIALTGSAIYNIDHPSELLHAGAFFDFNSLSHVHNYATEASSRVDYVADCSSLARVSLIRTLRIFYDESYFIHVEDIDFPLMFKKSGYLITVDPRSKVYHKKWHDVYNTKLYIVYYDIRNMLYITLKLKPDLFQNYRMFRALSERNVYHFLFFSIIDYVEGNVHAAKFTYNAVRDFYRGRMGKADPYGEAGIDFISQPIKNKTIILPELTMVEDDHVRGLIAQYMADCRTTKFPHMSRIQKVWAIMKEFRAHDYVVIPNPSSAHLLYPLLGKQILKLENGHLCAYKLSYIDLIRYVTKTAYLAVCIALKKSFRFDLWRNTLVWTYDKNQDLVDVFKDTHNFS